MSSVTQVANQYASAAPLPLFTGSICVYLKVSFIFQSRCVTLCFASKYPKVVIKFVEVFHLVHYKNKSEYAKSVSNEVAILMKDLINICDLRSISQQQHLIFVEARNKAMNDIVRRRYLLITTCSDDDG